MFDKPTTIYWDELYAEDVIVKFTGGKHSIALDEAAKLPDQIANTIMLFKGSIPNSFVVLTEIKDKSGNDVVAAIHLNKRQKRIHVNRIASLYGKDNVENYVKTNIEEGNLLDADTKKASLWLTNRGLQLPKLVQAISDAKDNLPQNQRKSNTQKRFSLPNTDTSGRELTAEQTQYFQNSKARNKKGELKVLYHGSKTANITEFRTQNEHGYSGLYLSDYRDIAESFAGDGGNIYEVYANFENPFVVDANNKCESKIEKPVVLGWLSRCDGQRTGTDLYRAEKGLKIELLCGKIENREKVTLFCTAHDGIKTAYPVWGGDDYDIN